MPIGGMVRVTTGDSGAVLQGSDHPLFVGKQRILLDLDGVVILDEHPIDPAPVVVADLRAGGIELRFVTNNASRPAAEVAQVLQRAGVTAAADEVVTSAMAAAALLARRHPRGAPILVVGGSGVHAALSDCGLTPVTAADQSPVAVMQGFSPEVDWPMLAEAAVAIRAGAEWVATNTDRTLPSPRGPLPGNGSLVAALATATGCSPESVGKPAPALYDAALSATAGPIDRSRVLAVGDRLDTDIAGARNAALASLLVLTGVSSIHDLVSAPAGSRPDFIGRDLRALQLPHPAATTRSGDARCGEVRAVIDGEEVRLEGPDSAGADGLDGLRAICALAWSEAGARVASSTYEKVLSRYDLN
jgi:HAD superfamily hydrolase (TIGR01450 family)